MDANLKDALENVSKALSTMSSVSAEASALLEKIKGSILPSVEELPSVILDKSHEPKCDLCGTCSSPWQEVDDERGLCLTCVEHVDDSLKYYTEEIAYAAAHGPDAIRLLVVRQRADNCRDTVAAAAGSYDGYLDLHEASLEEKWLNKRAAECLARLPAAFAPWWKDTWSHEKWCQVGQARDVAGWPVEKSAPIVQRLASMFVAEQNKTHEMKKAHAEELQVVEKRLNGEMEVVMKHKLKEMEAKHAEVLANIERARKEDLGAVEARHKREMAERDKRYVEALDPLLGVRDKMRAECDKKCHDAERKGYAMGYAFADQKWNPVYKAVCEELELVRKEGANHQAGYIRLLKERDELILAQADLRQELDAMAEANEELEGQVEELHEELAAARKELSGWCERCVAAQNAAETLRKELDAEVAGVFNAMESDIEGLRAEKNKLEAQVAESNHWRGVANQALANANWDKEQLVKSVEALRELVGPTQKLMQSNPELFGGEARGASSPRPPPIIRLKEEVSEEGKQRALKFLRDLVDPSRTCQLVESSPSVLPGIVEAEPCSSQTEGLCMALTEEQYQEMMKTEGAPPLPPSPPESPLLVPDQPAACGAGGCIDCPPLAEPLAEPLAKPKPNYNHPNWPSPITKRFAKHLATHSALRSPWHGHDPKTIKTHENALEYIAKRVNISVENLLGWTMKQYQTTYEPWTLVKGPNNFQMGTAPATWWC
jgi:hypothetical protein